MPISIARWSAALILVSLLASCSKKEDATVSIKPATVALVPEAERSPHFDAVDSHLELGGTLYGYADVDGDILELADPFQRILKQVAEREPGFSMFAKQDFKVLAASLGLDDVKAIGVSSVHQADGLYRNRTFLYTPQGRHGIFAVFGGKPAPFAGTRMAPADVDLYFEFDFDLKALYDAAESIIAKVNGPEAAADFRKKVHDVGANAHYSLLDLIEGFTGRATIIFRFDPEKTFTFPGATKLTVPAFSMVVRVDGIGPAIEAAEKQDAGKYDVTTVGTMRVYTLKAKSPIDGLAFSQAFEGKAYYLTTSRDFLAECANRKEGLDKNAAFMAALTALGPEGNGLSWVSPRYFSRIRELGPLNASAIPQMHSILDSISTRFPTTSQPLIAVRTNLPDGILMRSVWNRSLKADLAMVAVYNPVTLGVIAAMAVPAFQKVRLNAQTSAIQNNLKMLALAADKYCQDHGVTQCVYGDIVGPDKAVKAVVTIAGEDYTSLVFRKGKQVRIRLPDGRIINYFPSGYSRGPNNPMRAPVTPPAVRNVAPFGPIDSPSSSRIKDNLRLLDAAANEYYEKNGTTTATYDDLVGPGKIIPAITPELNEDYHTIIFMKGRHLRVFIGDGRWVEYPQN